MVIPWKSGLFLLKSCPRCGGDLFIDRDIYGHYISCLQCGYMLDATWQVDPEIVVEPPKSLKSTIQGSP